MAKKGTFFKEFLKEGKSVGAISPSSKYLGRKICSKIDFSKADNILELGPGNGVFTVEILSQMKKDARLYCLETNETFVEQIKSKIKDDRLILLHDTAENIQDIHDRYHLDGFDYIVSSLPYTVLPKPLKHNVLSQCVNTLKPEGKYLQFQYSLNAKGLLKSYFKTVKINFTFLNMPPAFIYSCSNE